MIQTVYNSLTPSFLFLKKNIKYLPNILEEQKNRYKNKTTTFKITTNKIVVG